MPVIMLDALVPVFFGMALGYLGGWTRDVDNKHVAELNALVMDFAVPASMFVTIVQASRRTLLDELPLAANLSISMLILYLVTYVMARRGFGADPGEASIQALTTSLPNYASAGLPLISALLGADHLVAAAVAIACGSIVVSPITLVILDRTSQTQDERRITASLVSAVTKPIVLSPILAVAFVLTGIGLPDPLTRSFTLMGQVAGGAGLFLTGLILSAQKLGLGINASIQTLLANVAHPLLAAALAWLFALPPLAAREAIVLSALPVGFFGVLFGLRFNKSSEVAGTTLIASTVLSAATLAAAIYLTTDPGEAMMSKTTLLTEGAATEAITRSADRICVEGDDQEPNASAHPWPQRPGNGSSLRRPAEAGMLRRHDLLRAEPAAWRAMLRGHPSVAALPLLADWARLGRPVIVRRRMASDVSDSVPAALPLPPCHGKLRVAFSFSSGAAVIALPPVSLCDAVHSAPAKWKPIISALLDLGETLKISPRVFGALLWEHTTGLPYLHAQSDLDLIWSVSDAQTAQLLVERLRRLDAESPVRLDGELQLPDFAGVNWRELAQNNDDERSQVLVKTMDGVEVRTKDGLFRTPISQS